MRRFMALALCLCLLPRPARGAPAPVTRGEFLLLLWADAGGVPWDVTAHPFSDLEGRDDLAQAAAWGWELGVVKGTGEGRFAPDRALTREECAAFLRRYDAARGREVWFPEGAAACNDFQDISPWADDSLYWACVTGRLPWRDSRLAPEGLVTWEEAEELFPALDVHRTCFSSASQV